MLGFATFAAIGGLVHAWQRIPTARYNAKAIDLAYWLLLIGISVMVVDLTLAGLVEAKLWQDAVPWLASVEAARPFWIVRSLSALPIVAGFVLLFVGLCTGPRGAGLAAEAPGYAHGAAVLPRLAPVDARGTLPARGLLMAYVVAGVAGIAFFALSVSLLGIWPGRELARQTEALAPGAQAGLTAAELRGREVYAREGCAYCHTQQIRFTAADIARFGAPTLAWETRFDFPHLWGTRRIGPDLARVAGTRSGDWHYAHLYSPRSVVAQSIMPAYPALFDGAPDRPRQEARDLVAYLETLGRARELAWPESDAAALAAAPDDHWAQMALTAPLLNAHPGRTRAGGDAPALPPALPAAGAGAEGLALWSALCAGCAGPAGRGDGPAAAGLKPAPTNLAEREYTRERLADVLWNGVRGTSMPAWRDYALEDLAALADVVAAFAGSAAVAPPSPGELALGAAVYGEHCAECHGSAGGGDGFAASALPVAPTNFRRQRPSLAAALNALGNGIDGTSMAPWTPRLDAAELLAVAHYLRSFYEPDADGGDR
jgi:mono/diheme cytochrome c family protein